MTTPKLLIADKPSRIRGPVGPGRGDHAGQWRWPPVDSASCPFDRSNPDSTDHSGRGAARAGGVRSTWQQR